MPHIIHIDFKSFEINYSHLIAKKKPLKEKKTMKRFHSVTKISEFDTYFGLTFYCS